jgi:copper homeostasis protein
MVAKAAGRIEIMAGSGVNPDNGSKIAKTGVDALHFSAKATRDSEMTYRSELVSFAPAGGSDFEIAFADPDFARAMVEIATAATTAFATK